MEERAGMPNAGETERKKKRKVKSIRESRI
jgi:hypothetical protein